MEEEATIRFGRICGHTHLRRRKKLKLRPSLCHGWGRDRGKSWAIVNTLEHMFSGKPSPVHIIALFGWVLYSVWTCVCWMMTMVPLNKCHKYKRMVLACLVDDVDGVLVGWLVSGLVMRYQSFLGLAPLCCTEPPLLPLFLHLRRSCLGNIISLRRAQVLCRLESFFIIQFASTGDFGWLFTFPQF